MNALNELQEFHSFLAGKLQNGGAGLSPEEALDEWRDLHPEPGDEEDDVAAEQRFNEYARQWKAETKFLSNITAKSVHPAYQKIIGMGEVAVPLILQDLKTNGPNDWFWALTMITNENPITEEIAGNMTAMTEAWLQWGTKIGYLNGSQAKKRIVLRVS